MLGLGQGSSVRIREIRRLICADVCDLSHERVGVQSYLADYEIVGQIAAAIMQRNARDLAQRMMTHILGVS